MTGEKEIASNIKDVLETCSQDLLFAYLFGSRIREKAPESGDIDIAVYLNPDGSDAFFDIKMQLYLSLSRALERNDIDIVVMNRCKNLMLLYAIIGEGLVIVDRDTDLRLDYEQKILHRALDFKEQRKRVMGV